jgi:hypothetical protein
MSFEYTKPIKFALDELKFSYRGEIFKGNGFLEWNPVKGFHIDALLDKAFAPVNTFKTTGQILVNDKNDAFPIWLHIKNYGRAIAPTVFPNDQKKSILPDNYLSMDLERVLFFNRLPNSYHSNSEYWSGSAVFATKRKIEFPDIFKSESTLGGFQFSGESSTGLYHDEDGIWELRGRTSSEETFELKWALHKKLWTRGEAWRFGEAARRALSIISNQTIWIQKQYLQRDGQGVYYYKKFLEAEPLHFYCRLLTNDNLSGKERWSFNKRVFLCLVIFFFAQR